VIAPLAAGGVRSGSGGGYGDEGGGGRGQQRRRGAAAWTLTFDEDLRPGVGDTVFVACLTHVLGLVVDGHGVDDETADAFAVLQLDVSARRDRLTVLHARPPAQLSTSQRHARDLPSGVYKRGWRRGI